MTDANEPNLNESNEPKKISLADAVKRKMEQKKQDQNQPTGPKEHFTTDTKKMRSQIKKKPNNQKKRTGV